MERGCLVKLDAAHGGLDDIFHEGPVRLMAHAIKLKRAILPVDLKASASGRPASGATLIV
jgi:hypothetical protein